MAVRRKQRPKVHGRRPLAKHYGGSIDGDAIDSPAAEWDKLPLQIVGRRLSRTKTFAEQVDERVRLSAKQTHAGIVNRPGNCGGSNL